MQNEDLIKICKKIQIDTNFQYNPDAFYKEKMTFLAKNCENILDIGKGSRDWFKISKY